MTRVRRFVHYAAPLGLIVFCWLTMRTNAEFSNESMTSYGFPFAWYAASGLSSMAYVIAIGPMLFDLALYAVLAYLAVSRLAPATPTADAHKWIVGALWTLALASLACVLVQVSMDPHFVAWSLDSYYGANARRSYGVQFGVGS